jgi:hypothetical protein
MHPMYVQMHGIYTFTFDIPKMAYTRPNEGINLKVSDVNSYKIMNYSMDVFVPVLRSLPLNYFSHRVDHRPINPLYHSDHFVA